MTWVMPLVLAGDNDMEELESGLDYLPRLAMHVLPRPEAFEVWLNQCLERLERWHTAPPADPFEDPFSEREEERRGPLVPPEALDPGTEYDPSQAPARFTRYLASVNPAGNPFLQSPDEMKRLGFPGIPYRI